MKHQTDLQLIGYINKYGCFFMSMIYWISLKKGKELDYDFLNTVWMNAISKGIISGDENKDGDMDDSNELLILDKNRLLALAGLDVKYIGSFSPTAIVKKPNVFLIGEFYNERTKFTHFAVIDDSLKCIYDPIKDSVTVREGKIKSVRVFG